MKRIIILCTFLTFCGGSSFGFESTKTLPKGIRNFNLKGVYTNTSLKTDQNGQKISLADSLWKPLKYKNIISSEENLLKRTQLQAFLLQQGLSVEESVGDFKADLNAEINVWAPILGWGLTDNLTLAVAIPYYSTSTDIQPGFQTNSGADDFLSRLTTPSMNNYSSASEASEKFRDAIGRLNNKLSKYNYAQLTKWNQSGWGDVTLALKYRALDQEMLKLATTAGLVAPTGRLDSPDILTDLPFGDGQWDLFSQLALDENLSDSVFLNQFVKYTVQARGQRRVAWKTFEESIEVPKNNTSFKLGDKIDAGVSVQFEQSSSGLTGGLGALYFRKLGDRYGVSDIESKNELQRNTDQNAAYIQTRLGYSTLPAFKRKEFLLPVSISFEYRKQAQSRNLPVTDLAQMDFNLFF